MKTNDINNSSARIWTTTVVNTTVAQCRKAHYTIKKDNETVIVSDPTNDAVVMKALKTSSSTWLTRISADYFPYCNYLEPAFVYVDNNNFIVYMNPTDSDTNRSIDTLKRFVIERHNLQIFIKYYQLRFHPYTKR